MPGKLRGIQQDALELLLGGVGPGSPFLTPHGQGNVQSPARCALEAGLAGRPHFAHFPWEAEEGPAHRCFDREPVGYTPTVSPKGNRHRQFPSFRTQTSLESRFRPLLFGGGGSCERNREAWSAGDGGQSGCSRARASPRARLPPPAGH